MADDGLNFGVTVKGGPARSEIDRIVRKLGDLGNKAVSTGGKVDKSVEETARHYANLAKDISAAASAEEKFLAHQANTQVAGSRAVVAGANAQVASSTVQPKIDQHVGKALLIQEQAATQEVRTRNELRQQENKNLLATSQASLLAERTEDIRANRANRQAKTDAANAAAKQKTYEQQGRYYDDYLNHQIKAQEKLTRAEQREVDKRQREQVKADAANARSARRYAKEREKEERDAAKVAAQQDKLYNSYMEAQYAHDNGRNLNSTRYALYDISRTALVAGAAIGGIGVASTVAAAQGEKAFAGVRRAAELTDDEANKVQSTLRDLSTRMPTNFTDLSQIAQIGAQMNVQERDLDGFSETISKFSATTNASIDVTATAFGKISNLLDVPAAAYDKLGSSIYTVGVKSVATETEILNTTQQISGAAAAYHFTADEVVGLSGAFASLAIAPEAARGSVTRIFGDIEKAVAKGGSAVGAYSRLIGKTNEETAQLWKTDPGQFFQQLIVGLSRSKNLMADLNSIGAKDVRDVNLMQRLAGNPELVVKSMQIAKDAYDDGTALTDAYAVATNNLIDKLTRLWNTVQALGAAAGGPLLAVLSPLTDLLNDFLRILSNIPFAPTVIAVVALAIGGFLVLKGATAAAMAALLAVRYVLGQLGEQAGVTGVSIAALRTQLRALAQQMGIAEASATRTQFALGKLKGAAVGFGKGVTGFAIVTTALMALDAAVSWVADSMKSASDKAKDYFGDTSGFAEAVAQDTKDYLSGTGHAIAVFSKDLEDGKKATGASSDATETWLGVQGKVPGVTDEATKVIESQTIALGDNAKAWVAKAFGDQEGIQKIANSPALLAAFKKVGGNVDNMMRETLNGKGKAYIDNLLDPAISEAQSKFDKLSDLVLNGDKSKSTADQAEAAGKYLSQLNQLKSSLGDATVNTDALVNEQKESAATTDFLGGKIGDTADDMDSAADSAGDLASQISNMFDALNSQMDFGAALQNVFQNVFETGDASLSLFYENGRQNLSNLQDAITQTIIYTQSVGGNTSETLSLLFQQLVSSGMDMDAILRSLASVPVEYRALLNIDDIKAKTAALQASGISAGSVTLNDVMTGKASGEAYKYSVSMKAAADNARSVADSTASAASNTADAAEKVRTLSDYASDLAGVFKDAFDFRFGVDNALDDIASKWLDIADAQKEAKNDLEDYRNELARLNADRAALDYKMRIALAYGDNIGAAQLGAQIKETDGQIADKQSNAPAAPDDSKTLQGNSKAAIENRATMQELVQAYEDYITSLAKSGLTQDELKEKVAQAKQEFINQATQLGYTKSDVEKAARAFDDMITIIGKVPRDITTNVNALTDPATKAIADWYARNTNGNGASRGVNMPIGATFNDAQVQKAARAVDLVTRMNTLNQQLMTAYANTNGNGNGLTNSLQGRINDIRWSLQSGNYASGGFIPWGRPGDLRKDNGYGILPNGNVMGLQGGEPIMTNAARSKYGDAMFEQINALKFKPSVHMTNLMTSGSGASVSQWSMADRSMIAELIRAVRAGGVLDSAILAGGVRATNVKASKRRAG